MNSNIFGINFQDKPEEVTKILEENYLTIKEVEDNEIISDPSLPINYIIEGDNFYSLNLLKFTHKRSFDLIYIDPPYNRPGQKFKYNNEFIDSEDPWYHSSWLSFMNHRLKIAKELLKDDGVFICAIDEKEQEALGLLLQKIFSKNQYEIEIIINQHNKRGKQGKGISFTHEYHYFVYPKDGKKYIFPQEVAEEEREYGHLRQWGSESMRDDPNVPGKKGFYPIYIKDNKVIKAGEPLPDGAKEPAPNEEAENGMIKVWPIDKNNVARKWAIGRNSVKERNQKGLLIVTKNSKSNLYEIKHAPETTPVKSLWYDKKYDANVFGTKLLTQVLGKKIEDMYPKSIYTLEECIKITLKDKKEAKVLDFFAGSGTTGHAVLNINKLDNGIRSFVMCTNNEDKIAEEVCYPRTKNVIKGYKFKGTIKKELFTKDLDYKDFENNEKLLKEINNLIKSNEKKYDKIKKIIENNCLRIIGEKKVEKKTDPIEANLKYFKIDEDNFISKTNNDLKNIFKEIKDIILFKNETYDEVKTCKDFEIYENDKNTSSLLFNHLETKKLIDEIRKIKKAHKIYIFSVGERDFSNEFKSLNGSDYEIKNMPNEFIKTYN